MNVKRKPAVLIREPHINSNPFRLFQPSYYFGEQCSVVQMSAFNDTANLVTVPCPWGKWWQTIGEVFVEVSLDPGTSAKDINCHITPSHIECIHQKIGPLLSGSLWRKVKSQECFWTIEDNQKLLICLTKAARDLPDCLWKTILVGHPELDEITRGQIEHQFTLERLQMENPGMDFSDATISGICRNDEPSVHS
ncbi:NudC domain-containing protein 2 [Clonorchis sinensis]|uniref:NudC domain-containing protein 2 n=1 Tax=Clonorchis sinensis TaxID=79923 RepID=A0A8T1M3S3_CLOSI|nr:NudC domain-containing protein 2 [Clonorchis sinensis]